MTHSVIHSSLLSNCRVIELPVVSGPRGKLTFIENSLHIPFYIERVYYLYDVPDGLSRAGHAHKKLQQILISMSGRFDVELDDAQDTQTFHLNRPGLGLYICPGVWLTIDNISSGSVCLALASLPYDKADYYRDYDEFLAARRQDS